MPAIAGYCSYRSYEGFLSLKKETSRQMDSPEPQAAAGEVLLRPGQAAALLGIRRHSLSPLGDSRRLTVQRTPGGHRRYLQSEIQHLAALLRTPAAV